MPFIQKKNSSTIPVTCVSASGFLAWYTQQSDAVQQIITAHSFAGDAGQMILLHDTMGALTEIIWGIGEKQTLYSYSALPKRLPTGHSYSLETDFYTPESATQAALGWALGEYEFKRFKTDTEEKKKTGDKRPPNLVWPSTANTAYVTATAEAIALSQDLINRPANDLGPEELEQAARDLAKTHRATCKVTKGKSLLKHNYPTIYMVGEASHREPRLVDIHWGQANHPKVTLVGKGVCFDTGGLNIKTGSYMDIMKKDMGGAAHVLALFHMIASLNLPIQLRVLVPIVDNAVGAEAFRPGDVVTTRKGITIEIDNTDAEGRLILCDALAEACTDKPDLIIDYATLTGAARVALGPEVASMMSNNDEIGNRMQCLSMEIEDPVWRLPLWAGYNRILNSSVADTLNSGRSGDAGAITAGLFLQKFISKGQKWVHIDTRSWSDSDRPGRPKGGYSMGMRAGFALLQDLYAKQDTKKLPAPE